MFFLAMPLQEAVRVPLIIKWPGGRLAGQVVERRVSIQGHTQSDCWQAMVAELGKRIDLAAPLANQAPLGDDLLSDKARRKLRSLGYIR